MPKRRRPYWDAERGQWRARIYGADGRAVKKPLGVTDPDDERAAWKAYEALQDAEDAKRPPPVVTTSTALREILGRFLDHVQASGAAATYAWYKHYLKGFREHVGRKLTIAELRPYHLTEWLDKAYPPPMSRHHPARAVKTALRWAADQKLIEVSPLAGVKVGKAGRLTETVSAKQRDQVRATAKDPAFADLLLALEQTGARVEEVRIIEARHAMAGADGRHVAWVIPAAERKRGEVIGKPRVIPLTAAASALSERLAALRPTGPLLLNARGTPWTSNAIRCRFRRRRDADPTLPKKLRGTMYRHAAAQDMSAAGANLHLVAQALGHTDLDMLARHYLDSLSLDQVREMLEKVRSA